MNTSDTLKLAASLLLEDAEAEQSSCSVGDKQWACPDCVKDADGKCGAQRHAHIRRRTAACLEVMAKP